MTDFSSPRLAVSIAIRPDCVETTASLSPTGYGQVGVLRFGKVINMAHRLAWIDANGPIPDETPIVLHKCDNPPCVNPDHLSVGTHADNVADKMAKGRHHFDGRKFCPKCSGPLSIRRDGERRCKPCVAAYAVIYRQSPEYKAARRARRNTDAGRAYQRARIARNKVAMEAGE